MQLKSLVLIASLFTIPWCTHAAEPQSATPARAPVHGIDPANLDTSVKPCEDFYQYSTGGWANRNPIPGAYPRWGTFDELQLRNLEALRIILEAAAKDDKAPRGSGARKLGDFYAAAMDEKKIEAEGAAPLAPEMKRIAAVKDIDGLAAEVARLHRLGVRALFGSGSQQDAKDATRVIAAVSQAGLSLPDRDYYLKEDQKSVALREAFVKHVANIFQLVGDKPDAAAAEAQTVLKLETEMAKASMTRVQRRDPKAIYNPMAVAKLVELAPEFPWTAYFGQVGLKGLGSLNVSQPDFVKALSTQLKAARLEDLKTYLRWHLARQAAPYLSSAFVKESFAFSQAMTGTEEDQPRWRKAVTAANAALGDILGQAYVKQRFSPESKEKVLAMLHNIRAALKEDLQTLQWMSEPTRIRATAKLEKIFEKIGYPDKWKDYSALEIDRKSYYENVLRANAWEFDRDIAKVGKSLDRTEWHMTVSTVNAYYNEHLNEIVFPAGILQPPFFDPQADDAVNYGAIGVVMGHEITHGFDDTGSQYDGEGNLMNWWTPEDLKSFQERGECIAKQFSGYVVDSDLHIQGKLVEGEAIADLGGVTLALKAYEKALNGKAAPAAQDGFTPEQRFFLGFATVWAGNIRPQYARMRGTVDTHPPDRWRVDGTLANVPAFAKAFSCGQGAMSKGGSDLCQIW